MVEFSQNALDVLQSRYLWPNETPEEMLWRVAKCVASVEKAEQALWLHKFYDIMDSLEFLPNSPTLMNAGKPNGQLSACFTLPIIDDLSAIFEAVKQAAIIHKSGGGTGFSFSNLRPKNSSVDSTRGVSSGPVSFMRIFNTATEVVKQGGKRRGANLGVLRVDHPDILEWIRCKRDIHEFQNFNISVSLTDRFLDALKNKKKFYLVNPHNRERTEIDPVIIWEELIESIWLSGEPGILFIDTMNRLHPIKHAGLIECTNPCGENPLLPYESCNLGSIDVSKLYKNGKFDYKRLEYLIQTSVRFLDNIISVNSFPRVKIERKTKKFRKIGLGIMGWADLLFQMQIPYSSQEALDLVDKIGKFMFSVAYNTSHQLAKERGSAFNGRRNATLLTMAPTGTLSMLANCSSGIEPNFSLEYTKEAVGKKFEYKNKHYNGTKEKYHETAHDLTPEHHVRMQAAWQNYVDNAVSKTINLSSTATREDIEKAILLAHELNCKGLTLYRDGTRDAPLQHKNATSEDVLKKCDGVMCEL